MKFDKHVTPECQKILLKQLKEYEQSFHDMTHEERHLLHMWVRKGNSPPFCLFLYFKKQVKH